MKFIVSSGSLLKQLQLIAGVVSSNTVLPILEDFLFDIKDGKLTLFSTDLETSMSAVMDVESNEDGKIAIPAKLLTDILKTLPEQPLTFSVNEKNLSALRHDERPNFIRGKLIFEWFAMGEENHEK